MTPFIINLPVQRKAADRFDRLQSLAMSYVGRCLRISFANGFFSAWYKKLYAKFRRARLHILNERTETLIAFLERKFEIAMAFLESIRQSSRPIYCQ